MGNKSTNGSKPRQYLSETQWKVIQVLWESGQYTMKALADMHGVSINTIKHRSSKGNWQEKGLQKEVAEKIKENTVEALARLGMPKEEWLKLIIEGARETHCSKNVKRPVKDESGKTIMQGQRPLIVEQTVNMIDNEATYKYRHMVGEVAGWFAPPKAALPPEPGEVKKEIPVVSNITPKPIPRTDEQGHPGNT